MDAHQKTLRALATLAIALLCSAALVGRDGSAFVGRGDPQPRRNSPTRIVSVVPAVTEMLFAMNAGPQVVGVGSYDHFPAEADGLPKVGALLDPDFEKILSLRPDLVIVYGTQTDFIARLQRASIPIFNYEHAGLPDITMTIRRLGERVGHAADANVLASGIEHDLDVVRARVASLPAVKTLLVFGREPGSLRGIYASGGLGFLHDLLVVAGGVDAFNDIKRQSVVISSEQILARGPDAIVELYGDDTTDAQLTTERDVWRQLAAVPAVRNHRIFLLRGDFLTVPGPRIAQVARLLADSLHPLSRPSLGPMR
jgi:iron complex transport system substrate-binding protein